MNNSPTNKQYCLGFSNQEIVKYLVEPLLNHPTIHPELLSAKEETLPINTEIPIQYINLGDNGEFYIRFFEPQVSIFTRYEEFMFLDDNWRKDISGSDTYGNVVYEKNLCDKTHEQILQMLLEVVLLLADATYIKHTETKAQGGFEHRGIYDYTVQVETPSPKCKTYQLGNIQFVFSKYLL